MNFAIIGAGIVGLTTALEVQKQFPQAKVIILADKFTTDTTSDVAAGLFRPSVSFSAPTDNLTK